LGVLSPTDEEKAQDSIGLDLELKDLVRFGQMFELAFIPNLPRVSHSPSFENIAYTLLSEQACSIHHPSN